MEWPSRQIPQGGILHPAKASYSPETQKFLKVLMQESNLSMMQRKKLDYILRNGKPLPALCNRTCQNKSNIPEVTIRPGSSKRRSRDAILSSGAYEREVFRPIHPVVDREKEKEKLANKMAYNGDVVVKKDKVIKNLDRKKDNDESNRFDQIVQEIQEREKWLKEMEELGEAQKYRLIIEQQIQNKVREMQKFKVSNN